MKKNITILLVCLCVVFLGVFTFSGIKLYNILHGYNEAKTAYTEIRESAVTTPSPSPAPGSDAVTPAEAGSPEEPEKSPIEVDFPALLAQSEDVVGWLYCEDTVINYPVVQGPDNYYYLEYLMDGTYNSCGTIYLDVGCNADFSSSNSILYGHHMNDGSMLASLTYYKDQSYYDKHPVLYLNTPSQNYKIELFSAFTAPDDSIAYTINFDTVEEYSSFLSQMKNASDFTCDVNPSTHDKIILFSTCTYEYDNARYLVLGVLTPVA